MLIVRISSYGCTRDRKFGEQERSVRVVRGAEIIKNFNNKVFPPGVVVGSAVQTSKGEKKIKMV